MPKKQKSYITKKDVQQRKSRPRKTYTYKGRGKGGVLVIRKSCLTDKVVWIYWGPTRRSANVAYHRACKKEIKRVNNWGQRAEQRRREILNVLNECLADIPITEALTPQQAESARQLRNLSKEDIACHREFYEHIMEERRRREEDKRIRRQMAERRNTAQADSVGL